MLFRFRRAVQAVAISVLLVACGESPDAPGPDVGKEPVVVFAAFEDDEELRQLMASYTDESGVRVTIRRGEAAGIVDDLIENNITPAADVLMTRSAVDVWRAAEEGALRAIQSESISQRLPVWAHDPDDLWAGTGFQTAVIAYDRDEISIDDSVDYEALADPRFDGAICLSSSGNSVNRTVIAMLIHELGVLDTQALVRGWVRNLAIPVLNSDSEVLDAILSGRCKFGLVSSTVQVPAELSVHHPPGAFADIDGIGIGRHARNPEGALALLEWMLDRLPADYFPGPRDVSQNNVNLLGWHQRDAALLAERVRYP